MCCKIIAGMILLVSLLLAILIGFSHGKITDRNFELFNQFKIQFNKQYQNTSEESEKRFTFRYNMKQVKIYQNNNPHATFGMTKFSDMTSKEFKVYHNSEKYYDKCFPTPNDFYDPLDYVNHSINWVDHGAVTPVKNQGQCGSCWSFSTTGNIEGQWAIKKDQLISLSEQELVSCDTTNNGCHGGIMDNAFEWLIRNKDGLITTERNYPYVSGMGNVPQCHLSLTGHAIVRIRSYINIQQNEMVMANWLYHNGPISIGVDASSWQTYTGGILTNCKSEQVDHGVLLVGFNDNHNPPYWVIKNSWGADWGENGYIRVAKGSNQCLLTTDPCSSVV
jgi:cysteine peptidase B